MDVNSFNTINEQSRTTPSKHMPQHLYLAHSDCFGCTYSTRPWREGKPWKNNWTMLDGPLSLSCALPSCSCAGRLWEGQTPDPRRIRGNGIHRLIWAAMCHAKNHVCLTCGKEFAWSGFWEVQDINAETWRIARIRISHVEDQKREGCGNQSLDATLATHKMPYAQTKTGYGNVLARWSDFAMAKYL